MPRYRYKKTRRRRKTRKTRTRKTKTRTRKTNKHKYLQGGTLNPLNDILGIFDSAKYQVSSAVSSFNIKPPADLNPTYPIDPNPSSQFDGL